MSMIRSSIDITKLAGFKESADYIGIPKAILAKGKYLNFTVLSNKNGVDAYGNTHYITQDVTKEERLAGKRGPILGNGKEWNPNATHTHSPAPQRLKQEDDGDLNF